MKEFILCSAIWYKEVETSKSLPKNVDRGVVVCGRRHYDCIQTMLALTGKRTVLPDCGEYQQGFITSWNRFVDREEAARIAGEASQIQYSKQKLYSEDLY